MYLFTHTRETPWIADTFIREFDFIQGMLIYNLTNNTYTIDGFTWTEVQTIKK